MASKIKVNNIQDTGSNDIITSDGAGNVTVNTSLNFGDNDKARFGTGNDLEIYHDGSNSYIKDTGTGDVFLQVGTRLIVEDVTDGSNIIVGDATAETSLFYAGNKKLETTSTGIDVTGTVTIGTPTVTPDGAANDLIIANTGSTGLSFLSGTSDAQTIAFGDVDAVSTGRLQYFHSDNHMEFTVNSSEAMRIDSSGDVLVNCTAIPAAGTAGFGIEDLIANIRVKTSTTTTANYAHYEFFNPNGSVGNISTGGSGTNFNTSSDYRLKENVVELTGATDRLKQIPVHRFNFIADADTTVDGFLAHEVSDIVPEAITGTHNEVEVWKEGEELPEGVSVGDNKLDDEGNTIPVYQGIDQSKLVPLLTASLKEAIAKIETLESTVADLTTRLEALENN